jgi:methylmalonyl-CoA/ethylmalonyl-CoA epimerase
MIMDKMPNYNVGQIALVVKDAEKTSKNIGKMFGFPEAPYEIIGTYTLANTMYMGKPTAAKAKATFYKMGSLDLEILEPMGEPSTWNDFLKENGDGIHHLAWYVKNIDEVTAWLEGQGMKMVQSGNWDGGQYKYFDSAKQLGFMLELLQTDK